jgi:hypothetical protein
MDAYATFVTILDALLSIFIALSVIVAIDRALFTARYAYMQVQRSAPSPTLFKPAQCFHEMLLRTCSRVADAICREADAVCGSPHRQRPVSALIRMANVPTSQMRIWSTGKKPEEHYLFATLPDAKACGMLYPMCVASCAY